MRIAIVAFARGGSPTIGCRILEALRQDGLEDQAELIESRNDVLQTLESLTGYDGVVIVEGAQTGQSGGNVMIVDFSETSFFGSPVEVAFDNLRPMEHLFYASKYLSLPPTLIVALECSELPESDNCLDEGMIERCTQAVRSAVARLSGRK